VAAPQQWASATNTPAWNAALPIGASAPAHLPAAQPPQNAGATLGSPNNAQASVVSLMQQALPTDPATAWKVGGNIAKVIGVRPGEPLTPEQADRAKKIIDGYVSRRGQQAATGGQGQPSGGGPIVPQVRLPNGAKDPQDAILMLDRQMADIARSGNPYLMKQIPFFEDWRNRIAASTAPMEVRPGMTLLDPRTGQTVFQAPLAGAGNIALQRFLAENPDATAEQIQQFVQAGRGGARSGVGMYMQRYLQEHPDATAEEVASAAQNFQSQGSALTKFTSGPQGNAIRSFNVLVDHLGTLSDAAGALKNGDMRVFNRIGQEIARQTGGSAPTNFDATKAIVGDELVKAVVGGGGALGDREEVKAVLDKANSPEQLAGVIEQYKRLALGQLRGLRLQYETATGRDDFNTKLAPGTRKFFGDEGEAKKQGAPTVGQVEDGYRFTGGDPSKKENWERVQ
jgi:hypothetical protein